jgi:hypothetical protein
MLRVSLIFLNHLGPLSEVVLLNKENENNFTLKILPEILFSVPIAMYFPKNHYLASIIDAKVKILHSAGLIDYWISQYLTYTNKEVPSTRPKMLTVEQLAGGMYVLLMGYGIGVLAFLAEISFAKKN